MKVVTLDNYTYNWKAKSGIRNTKIKNKSKLHLQARKLLRNHYESLVILEEVSVQILNKKKKILYFDFYIPSVVTVIEVHGQQHYEYSSYFYKHKMEFYNQQQNDIHKIEWCQLNNIKLIILPYYETVKIWQSKL